jgi:hypothetical protein
MAATILLGKNTNKISNLCGHAGPFVQLYEGKKGESHAPANSLIAFS